MRNTPAGDGGSADRCPGRRTLSKSRCKPQLLCDGKRPSITIDGNVVRIIADAGVKLDIPRRQSFAWARNANDYAAQLSRERGWPIEMLDG